MDQDVHGSVFCPACAEWHQQLGSDPDQSFMFSLQYLEVLQYSSS